MANKRSRGSSAAAAASQIRWTSSDEVALARSCSRMGVEVVEVVEMVRGFSSGALGWRGVYCVGRVRPFALTRVSGRGSEFSFDNSLRSR
jgi:hypothetical protein